VGDCPHVENTAQALPFRESPGWVCTGLRLDFPIYAGRLIDREQSLADNAKAFNKHNCKDYPRKKKPTREDVNQTAARDVRKLTEGK
jgi:hypothetical protein